MIIGFQAQVVLNGLGQVTPVNVLDVIEERLHYPDKQCQRAERQQLHLHFHQAQIGKKGFFAAYDDVHCRADQHRWHDVK